MTIEDAAVAYKAAQAEVAKQQGLLTKAASDSDAADAPFGNSSTVVREGYRIPEQAMVVIRGLKSAQDTAHASLDRQIAATSLAISAKDQAKLDFNNAIRDSDLTSALEAV